MLLPNLSSSAPERLVTSARRLVIIGNRGGTNVGDSFEHAAGELGLPVKLMESNDAMRGLAALRRLKWRLLQKTPLRLKQFSANLLTFCAAYRPHLLLTTGLAPVDAPTLRALGAMGVKRANFLTDDPWNPDHRARWFFESLRHYDYIFTVRRANITDLQSASSAAIHFLRFGYDPRFFFPVDLEPDEAARMESDVMFAGGADGERVPYIAALRKAGINVALYGSYWERFSETKLLTHGQIGVEPLRKAIAGCKVALCLVRRANRDGHSMRTFEVPAVGAAMLTEDTEDHREIFGPEGEHVIYFRDAREMTEKARWLLDNPAERQRLKTAAHRLIREASPNRYEDRLSDLIKAIEF